MRRKLVFTAVALILIGLGAWGWTYYQANKDFTPWMSHDELDTFMKQFDTNPPGGHPNYWDNGHWINAVEGRWHDGIPQYRIRYGERPQGYHYGWYWYLNMDQQSFSNHVHELADQGFVLLDPNSFLRPDDTRRYQGVWHRLGGKLEDKPVAASATPPAGSSAPVAPPVSSTPPLAQAPPEAPVSEMKGKIKEVLAQATQAVLNAKDPKEIDPLLTLLGETMDKARADNTQSGADRQFNYNQLEGASRFLKGWQTYLIDKEAGNAQAASNELHNLAMINNSFMPIPRSELLARSTKETALSLEEMETKIQLNSLDDLSGAITQLEQLQRNGNYSAELNGLSSTMQTLQSAYSAYKDKNYTGALQQLASNPSFFGMGASQANGDKDPLRKKLTGLKNTLTIEVVQGLLAMPDAPAVLPDETAPDYLLRLAVARQQAADWTGLQQVLQIYQQTVPFNAAPWLQEDLAGLRAYFVGQKLEKAGEDLDAIRAYRQAVATVGKYFPGDPAVQQLDALKKKYPALYQQALQKPISESPPGG